MNLHLGCGKVRIPGYVNVDCLCSDSVDVLADIRQLPFANGSVETIYMCSVLEHLSRSEWRPVLSKCYDLLCSGGVLYVSAPDFEIIAQRYLETYDLDELLGLLRISCDRHGMIFDNIILASALMDLGFYRIAKYNWHSFIVGELGIDDFSQAYLPHMDKKNGTLMMLNVKAVK